jgi:drug/metabolite transporter (DMT)-like permease
MAIPILGEHLTRSLFAGGALVLSGVWMTERG